TSVRRSFGLSLQNGVVVVNRNMVLGGSEPGQEYKLIDSDGDGIPDEDEKNGTGRLAGTGFKTDPTKRDSDGDGCGDGLEIRNGWDPTKNVGGTECVCNDPTKDSDGDGL